MDTLSPIIDRHTLSANTFFSGVLCGSSSFSDTSGPGHLHLVRKGSLTLEFTDQPTIQIDRPSAVLIVPPVRHRLEGIENQDVELVCAEIALENNNARLLPFGMPNPLVVELASARGLDQTLSLLFDEAANSHPGSQAAINRLMELLFILLLRHCHSTGTLQPGLLSGLAHPQLAKTLLAMHDHPGNTWNLTELADHAAMSRTKFAAQFKEHVGTPPGEYLTSLRITHAQTGLILGHPLKVIAANVGYADATALARAFKQKMGISPRAWLAEQTEVSTLDA